MYKQNFGRICKIPISEVKSLNIHTFNDVREDVGTGSPIDSVNPTLQLQGIVKVSVSPSTTAEEGDAF